MRYKVTPWVRDADLEAVLNEPDCILEAMFRNTPGRDGQETTTVIQFVESEADRLLEEVGLLDMEL